MGMETLDGQGCGMEKIELAAAVQVLRQELLDAASAAEGQGVTFEVGDVQMDFEIELHADARAKGGFKAWVLSGEVDGSMGRRRTQRISLTLKPKNAATRATVEIGGSSTADLAAFGPPSEG